MKVFLLTVECTDAGDEQHIVVSIAINELFRKALSLENILSDLK